MLLMEDGKVWVEIGCKLSLWRRTLCVEGQGEVWELNAEFSCTAGPAAVPSLTLFACPEGQGEALPSQVGPISERASPTIGWSSPTHRPFPVKDDSIACISLMFAICIPTLTLSCYGCQRAASRLFPIKIRALAGQQWVESSF